MRTTDAYLIQGRLADVLALIQVLAYDRFAKRTDEGLATQLRRRPWTSDTWISIGRDHPELFRVLEAERHSSNQETVTLIARFAQAEVPSESPGEASTLPPLTAETTGKLMELAMELHDREAAKRDWWKPVIGPAVAALITAVTALGSVYLTAKWTMDKPAVQKCARA